MADAKTIHKVTKRSGAKATKWERLVHAAAECFREGGIRATTIKIIAERANVPIGNVYYYFKTKEDIASAVVASWTATSHNKRAGRNWTQRKPSTHTSDSPSIRPQR